jgi:hypothetical protein
VPIIFTIIIKLRICKFSTFKFELRTLKVQELKDRDYHKHKKRMCLFFCNHLSAEKFRNKKPSAKVKIKNLINYSSASSFLQPIRRFQFQAGSEPSARPPVPPSVHPSARPSTRPLVCPPVHPSGPRSSGYVHGYHRIWNLRFLSAEDGTRPTPGNFTRLDAVRLPLVALVVARVSSSCASQKNSHNSDKGMCGPNGSRVK